jgi:fructose-1,6-bisphosphatase II
MPLTNANQPTKDILAATVAAAAAAWPHVGLADKLRVDGAAVDAMRASLSSAQFAGIVVIGEGEKDEAPMLFNGEVVGHPDVIALSVDWDIAVDPVDGTRLAAEGMPGAVAVMAAAERGSMLESSEVYMMKKIVRGRLAGECSTSTQPRQQTSKRSPKHSASLLRKCEWLSSTRLETLN